MGNRILLDYGYGSFVWDSHLVTQTKKTRKKDKKNVDRLIDL